MGEGVEKEEFEPITPEAVYEFMASFEKTRLEDIEKARKEGRVILEEETSEEIIAEWFAMSRNCSSIEEAAAFAQYLMRNYHHDYGTICYAMSAAILAMAWGVNGEDQAHITGFQSGAVMWGFVSKWMNIEGPARLQEFEHLLYPQYDYKWAVRVDTSARKWLTDKAQGILKKDKSFSPIVQARLELIASGRFPDFVEIAND